MSLNVTIITGRLTRDPQTSQTSDGKTKTTFTVAVDRDFKPKGAEYPESDYYYCIAYDKTADFISKFFVKGRPIELMLKYRQYKQKDDNKTSHYFLVDRAGFVPRDTTQNQSNDLSRMNEDVPPNYEPDITDDDMPF